MKRIKMTVAYDGTGYCGWQLQPNGVTIEEILNGTLSELLKEPVCVIGASRTDLRASMPWGMWRCFDMRKAGSREKSLC